MKNMLVLVSDFQLMSRLVKKCLQNFRLCRLSVSVSVCMRLFVTYTYMHIYFTINIPKYLQFVNLTF
jgi:hypothetical protein